MKSTREALGHQGASRATIPRDQADATIVTEDQLITVRCRQRRRPPSSLAWGEPPCRSAHAQVLDVCVL